ncbi:MAG TPA: hypothetical protein VNA15_04270 [Candidatus Angelobacter sp.]|nr:hypothetical protein [Candidatus Angelobacter sp.]
MTRGQTRLKFIQSLSPAVYSFLGEEAKRRMINIQQLVRAIIIPEWLEKLEKLEKAKKSTHFSHT